MRSSINSTTPVADTSAMGALEILRQARALIEDESHWCRGWYAVGERGREVRPYSPKAVRWCAQGAVLGLAGGPGPFVTTWALCTLAAAAKATYPHVSGVPEINDSLGHAAVLELYDAAIATLEREAAP